MKKEFQTEIRSPIFYSFEVEEDGLYTITVKAFGKPGWRNKWWLNFKGLVEDILDWHLDDEDLRVEIDDLAFKKPKGKRGLFNSPVAFSGTKTLAKTKTVIFIISLAKGSHTIKFIPDGAPYLESLEIEEVKNPLRVNFFFNIRAGNENYYSWYALALVKQPLKTVAITAQAGILEGEKDDDDLKIFINGDLQKNFQNRHQDSYFCGFTLKGREDTFIKDLNLPKDIHYFEFFADKKPILKKVEFEFSKISKEPIKIQRYKDERFGRDYNQLDQYVLSTVSLWNGFFLDQEYPPPSPLDPSLVKAIIYRESRLGYYPNENIVDVMQVWDPENPARPAILGETTATEFITSEKIGHISYSYPKERIPPKVEGHEKSIFWGVRWLYHKAQYLQTSTNNKLVKPYLRRWRNWEETIRRYNANPKIVEDYIKEVFMVYEKGVDLEGNVLWEK